MVTRRILLSATAAAVAGTALSTHVASADTTVTVDPTANRYVRRADVVPSGQLVRLAVPAGSVQTVQLDGAVP